MSDEQTASKNKLHLILIIVPAILVILQAVYFDHINRNELGLGMPIDDAYIFKRYAENIAAGNGYSFNPGETSFGGTSVIWPVVMAMLKRVLFFLDYVTIAFWFGAVMAAGAASGAVAVVKRHTGKIIPAFLAGIMIAASPLIFMNAVSGMETSITIALLVAFSAIVLAETPRPIIAGLIAGLLTLNRPEALYFPIGAALAWLIILPFKKKRIDFFVLLKFIAAWAILALPAGLIVYVHTGSVMPTTYLGKIMSTAPWALERGFLDRLVWGVMNLGAGWLGLAGYLHGLGALAVILIGCELIFILRSIKRPDGPGWIIMGLLILFGFLFLPGAYGFSFPVGPAFGGYYLRYIAPVFVVAAILAMIGLSNLYDFICSRYGVVARLKNIWVPAALVMVIGYLCLIWSFQSKDALSVFKNEVRLNTGLRMDAARWIADPENTPTDARVMAGYTGLGVVGGNCGRYVLDLGALINPDIFDYYKDAPRDPQGRWDKVVEYMRDRGVTYYVTFAFTEEYEDKIADPARTPGFSEVARLGSRGEPESPYEQIRIYRIDR